MELTMLVALSALVVVVASITLQRHRAATRERRRIPKELQGAELAYSEQTFRSWQSFGLVARIDRAYRKDGALWLVELKTRRDHRPYLSDVIELSAQKLAIEGASDLRVSNVGFVITTDPSRGTTVTHRVELLDAHALTRLKVRRDGLLDGTVVPQRTAARGLCRKCAFRNRCYGDEEHH